MILQIMASVIAVLVAGVILIPFCLVIGCLFEDAGRTKQKKQTKKIIDDRQKLLDRLSIIDIDAHQRLVNSALNLMRISDEAYWDFLDMGLESYNQSHNGILNQPVDAGCGITI